MLSAIRTIQLQTLKIGRSRQKSGIHNLNEGILLLDPDKDMRQSNLIVVGACLFDGCVASDGGVEYVGDLLSFEFELIEHPVIDFLLEIRERILDQDGDFVAVTEEPVDLLREQL